MNDLKDRLSMVLKQRNMSAYELAKRSGVDKGSISRYLSGEFVPKKDAVDKMAHVLNVSPDWLERGTMDSQDWGERFRIPMTVDDAVKNYKRYQEVIRASQKAIRDSSDIRAYLNKNIATDNPWHLLRLTCDCIADLTGDTAFGHKMAEEIYKRKYIKGA